MQEFAQLALYGFIPLSMALFCIMPAWRAVLVTMLIGYLFLPNRISLNMPLLPDMDRQSVVSYAMLLGVILFDTGTLLRLKPKWIDLPMILWCSVPVVSSITNNRGVYDGLVIAAGQWFTWGIPYFMGRMYIHKQDAVWALCYMIVIGGLLYLPLILIEAKMSPQLHRWIYGEHQHTFQQVKRMGGYRPMVFMRHGLMVSMWMCLAALSAGWLWSSGTIKRVKMPAINISMLLASAILLGGVLLCRSAAAMAFMVMGIGLMFALRTSKLLLPLALMALIPMTYATVRVSGVWDGGELVDIAAQVFNEDRASSMQFRFDNEQIMVNNAMNKPFFGYGRGGQWRDYVDERGRDRTATADGMWVIALGWNGLVGLVFYLGCLTVPVMVILWQGRGGRWLRDKQLLGAVGLSILVVLYTIDCLPNAMLNPWACLFAGSIAGVAVSRESTQRQPATRSTRQNNQPQPAISASSS